MKKMKHKPIIFLSRQIQQHKGEIVANSLTQQAKKVEIGDLTPSKINQERRIWNKHSTAQQGGK